MAALVAAPELALTDDESRRLATAIAEVDKHFTLPKPPPGTLALGVLAWTAFSVYGGKAKAIALRKRQEAATAAADPAAGQMPYTADATVVELPQGGTSATGGKPAPWFGGLGQTA